MTVRLAVCGGLVALAAVCALGAQDARPAFEVASVRPQHEPLTAQNVASGAIPRALPGGRFSHSHLTVDALLLFAYDLKPYQVEGLPDWARSERFAIDARAAGDVPPERIKLMGQRLLEDRFKLVTRKEARPMRVQALVRARPDGALGRNIFRMEDECTPAVVNELRRKLPGKYLAPSAPGMMSGCSPSGVNYLADYLMLHLGVPVIDATGLQGPHYYSLTADLPAPSSRLGAPRSNPDNPALSTALAEQLGLKLESRNGPVDVLVVESVQRPAEN